MKINIKLLHPNAKVPEYQTEGAVAFDLHAIEDFYIWPNAVHKVPTGLTIHVPEGFELQIRPRSGVTLNTPLRVHLGTIDQDYRGEIKVMVSTDWNRDYSINAGDRIAQAVLAPISKAEFEVVEELSETNRGQGGWGSTGA